jgi:hypothetical protein
MSAISLTSWVRITSISAALRSIEGFFAAVESVKPGSAGSFLLAAFAGVLADAVLADAVLAGAVLAGAVLAGAEFFAGVEFFVGAECFVGVVRFGAAAVVAGAASFIGDALFNVCSSNVRRYLGPRPGCWIEIAQ